jgi:hypothetical protein
MDLTSVQKTENDSNEQTSPSVRRNKGKYGHNGATNRLMKENCGHNIKQAADEFSEGKGGHNEDQKNIIAADSTERDGKCGHSSDRNNLKTSEQHKHTNHAHSKHKNLSSVNKNHDDKKQDLNRHSRDKSCLNINKQADDKTSLDTCESNVGSSESKPAKQRKCKQPADAGQTTHGQEDNCDGDHVAVVSGMAGRSPERRLPRDKAEVDKTQAEGYKRTKF